MVKYIQRLVKEWLEHGKIVIACDFDDTLKSWKLNDPELYEGVVATIKRACGVGAYLSIWSACAPERFDEIREYCKSLGLYVSSINENPISLPYGNHRKMFANIYLDDRAGLEEALSILERAIDTVVDERKQLNQQNEHKDTEQKETEYGTKS